MKPYTYSTHTAESIYAAVYGDLDDHRFRDAKVTEIHDWLAEGSTTGSTLDSLVNEWWELDGDDREAKGV